MRRERKRWVIAVVVSLEILSAGLALRDLAGRPAEEVRGTKRMWRWIVTVNPGNSLIYWAIGGRWRGP